MSSTNRGAERRPNDYYPTPPWLTSALLGTLDQAKNVLDPCAGEGAILHALRETWPGTVRHAVEIEEYGPEARARADRWTRADFLTLPVPEKTGIDLVVMNPPFSLAMPMIERAMLWAPSCWVLLSMGFLTTPDRSEFLRKHLAELLICPQRPSFVLVEKIHADGTKTKSSSDSSHYAWFRFEQKLSTRLTKRFDHLPLVEDHLRLRWDQVLSGVTKKQRSAAPPKPAKTAKAKKEAA